MDAFIMTIREVSVLILPILGAAVLIFLLVLLKNIFDILKKANQTIDQVNKTLLIVDDAMEDVQAALKTVRMITNGIDTASAIASQSITKLAKLVIENYDSIKNWILVLFKRDTTSSKAESMFEPDEGESI